MKEAHPSSNGRRSTGLSVHVIRIWEQRYRAVEPRRTSSNRGLYSQERSRAAELLRDLTNAGRRIGQMGTLPDQEAASGCRRVAGEKRPNSSRRPPPGPADNSDGR